MLYKFGCVFFGAIYIHIYIFVLIIFNLNYINNNIFVSKVWRQGGGTNYFPDVHTIKLPHSIKFIL